MDDTKSYYHLNASLESFVHKILKDEQIECIRRIVCHGRDVLAVLPMGFGKSAIYHLIPKVLFHMGRTANATSKITVAVSSPLDYIRKEQVTSIEKWIIESALRLLGNQSGETSRSKMERPTSCSACLLVFGSAEQWLSDRWRKAVQFGAIHQTKVSVVDEVRTQCGNMVDFIYVVFMY